MKATGFASRSPEARRRDGEIGPSACLIHLLALPWSQMALAGDLWYVPACSQASWYRLQWGISCGCLGGVRWMILLLL